MGLSFIFGLQKMYTNMKSLSKAPESMQWKNEFSLSKRSLKSAGFKMYCCIILQNNGISLIYWM